jgi:hypothetical protein
MQSSLGYKMFLQPRPGIPAVFFRWHHLRTRRFAELLTLVHGR